MPCASTNPIFEGFDAGVGASVAHETRLRIWTGQHHAVGVSVLIERRPGDDALDGIAVLDRLRKPLQQHHAGAFPTHEAICRSVERLAVSIWRKHRSLGKADEAAGGDHDRHPAGQRHRAAARPEVLAGHMHRRQRRGARRVHGDARAAQVQAIGDAVRRDAVRGPGGRMRRNTLRVPRRALDHLVVVVRNANEHAEVCALFKIEDQARVLDCLPRRLQEQAMLRIHIGSLARGNAEELRIKLVDPIDEATTLRDGLASQAGLRIVIAL